MTKLEGLKVARDAAYAYDAACAAADAAHAANGDAANAAYADAAYEVTLAAYVAAYDAYQAELKKAQEEKPND